ncbi:cellular retinoic acid-binding protein 2b [Etheostoma cragini]|uniref:cellular retinoic acid-binding protein 2b n=1 Tax=Etheostoma cragini TaxID=417921 RepID=UPI00155F17B9|nr:cellular retinoic acid-binding protein 2b [Etheostoma cragini]
MSPALVSKSFTTLTEVEGTVRIRGKVPPCHRPLYWLDLHQIQASCQPISGSADAGSGDGFANQGGGQTDRGDWSQNRLTTTYYTCKKKMEMEKKIPDFSGKWKMKSSENFEGLLKELGVNVFLRKIAATAASSPAVEITQQDESLSIKTSTSVRTTHVSFTVGQSFNETTVDGRPCTSFPKWETDSKISCEQTLQKGDGPKTAWTRELTNNGELILTMTAGDVVCTRVYERE